MPPAHTAYNSASALPAQVRHVAVPSVSYEHVLAVHPHTDRRTKLPCAVALAAQRAQRRAVGRKHHHAVVAFVSHEHAGAIRAPPYGTPELPESRVLAATC